MNTCPKCHVETQSLEYHTCQMTVEMVREMIGDAIAANDEHVRTLAREEIRVSLYGQVSAAPSTESMADYDARIRNEALEEAAERLEYECDLISDTDRHLWIHGLRDGAAKIRSLKHTLPDQELDTGACREASSQPNRPDDRGPQAGEVVRPEIRSLLKSGACTASSAASPSSLREFDALLKQWRIAWHDQAGHKHPAIIDERYTTARSRIDVGEIERAVEKAYENGRGNALVKCSGEIDRLRERLDHEIKQFQGADRGRAEALAEVERLRGLLSKTWAGREVDAAIERLLKERDEARTTLSGGKGQNT